MKTWLLFLLCLFARTTLACGTGDIVTAPDGEYKAIDKVEFTDFKWLAGTLKKAPDLKSAHPRYAVVVLGEGRQSTVTLIVDESQGTGTGYDTLYADTNFNGDLTEPGKKFAWKMIGDTPSIDLGTLKESGGDGVFTLLIANYPPNLKAKPDDFKLVCKASSKTAKGQFSAETCWNYTGGIHTAADLNSAPVYHLHGEIAPVVFPANQKPVVAGTHLGTYRAGDAINLGYQVSILGSGVNHRFDFFWAGFPAPVGSSSPVTFLRVKDKDNRLIEEFSFTGGGG